MKTAIGILCILWIWLIYEWKNAPNDLVVCKVEKNRHGATKNLALRFLPETMTFQDYTNL